MNLPSTVACLLLFASLAPFPIVAQQQPPGLSREEADAQLAALLFSTKKYSGKEADEIRTPAEKLVGKLDLVFRGLPNNLIERDLSLIKAYAAVDVQHMADSRNGMVNRQRAICSRTNNLSALEMVNQMNTVTNESRLNDEEYYEGLLRSLSKDGREALIATADKMFGGGTLIRVDGVAFSAAAPEAAAYNIRAWCEKPLPPPPAPSKNRAVSSPFNLPSVIIYR